MKTRILKIMKCTNNHKMMIHLLYVFCIIGMLFIATLVNVTKEKPENHNSETEYIEISDKWTLDSDGQIPVNVTTLGDYMDEKTGVISIYYQLPELTQDVSFIYRSKDVYTSVLIDGQKIYETSVYDSKWYNDSPGNLWNILTINSNNSGKCLELQVKMVYDTNAITIDSLMLGDKAEIILDLLADNLMDIIVSLLLILIGFVLMILNFLPSYGKARNNNSLLWLGLFALMTGIWCLIETNMIQFCVPDMRKLQMIDNMLMIISSVPLLIYMDCEHDIFNSRAMRMLVYVNIAYIMLCIFVQLSTLGDFHNMLNGSVLLMVITDIVLFVLVVARFMKQVKDRQPLLNSALHALGICSLWFMAFFESARSYNTDRIDRAGLIRIGMLLLCLFWAMSSQIKTYKLIEQGLKFDLVSRLAYSDGLTGIGNRTAFTEKLEEYQNETEKSNISKIGIVYFDINNLKKVNDSQGHEMGDTLLQAAAESIMKSFGLFGEAYRIGGDEFSVIMEGKDLKKNYEKGYALFEQIIAEKNESGKYPFTIQIAHGFAICDELTCEKIDEAVSIADSAMYENKIRMKTNLLH